MNKQDLFTKLKEDWQTKNIKFFGSPVETKDFISDQTFKEYADKYWNDSDSKNRCTLCNYLYDNFNKFHMESFIQYDANNPESGFILGGSEKYNIIYGWFNNNSKVECKPVFLIPKILPNLQWKISSARYIPRGTIKVSKNSLTKINDVVKIGYKVLYVGPDATSKDFTDDQKDCFFINKSYDVSDNDPIEKLQLDERSKMYLTAFYPDFSEKKTIAQFKKWIKNLPSTRSNNIINYNYYDFSFFFNAILNGRFPVDPINSKPGNISSVIINAGRGKFNSSSTGKMREEELQCTLIINNENLDVYAMSNFRNVIYVPDKKFLPNGKASKVKSAYVGKCFFSETEVVFDAFKTTTSKNAGIVRTLLDDVEVSPNGILYKTLPNGDKFNQFELYKKYFIDHDESVKTNSLSCLSETIYCTNNDPKRIMMTAKSIGQSVPISSEYEYDPIIHSSLARVVLGDFYGLTNGDAIVMSKSFAKKMLSSREETFFISSNNSELCDILNAHWDFEKSEPIGTLSIEEFTKIAYYKSDVKRYNNIRIIKVKDISRDIANSDNKSGYNIIVRYDIHVKNGDKFTNLHGSKGVISRIFDDDKMPKLIKKCGEMEPGPFDVIISSYGIAKRGNIGQICEAFSRMKGLNNEVPLKELFKDSEKYDEPLIEYKGKLTSKCFGLQEVLRLHHLSVSHSSLSGIDKEEKFMLNFGEQENAFLIALNYMNIQTEINQRSPKYNHRERNINSIIMNKELLDSKKLNFNMELMAVFYSLAYDVSIEDCND